MSADLARGLLATLAVPPVSLMFAALLGGLAVLRGARIGAWIVLLAASVLLALSTSLISGLLMLSLDSPELPTGSPPPTAIVVLGAETRTGPEGADIGPLTLERLRRAADLQRNTGLPLLVTAGVTTRDAPPLAELMRQTLEESFRVPVRWVESAARNTAGNAANSAAILAPEGFASVFVVTHAWHMRRARAEISGAGLVAWPIVVHAERIPDGRLTDWIPRPDQLMMSWFALREWTGILAQQLGF